MLVATQLLAAHGSLNAALANTEKLWTGSGPMSPIPLAGWGRRNVGEPQDIQPMPASLERDLRGVLGPNDSVVLGRGPLVTPFHRPDMPVRMAQARHVQGGLSIRRLAEDCLIRVGNTEGVHTLGLNTDFSLGRGDVLRFGDGPWLRGDFLPRGFPANIVRYGSLTDATITDCAALKQRLIKRITEVRQSYDARLIVQLVVEREFFWQNFVKINKVSVEQMRYFNALKDIYGVEFLDDDMNSLYFFRNTDLGENYGGETRSFFTDMDVMCFLLTAWNLAAGSPDESAGSIPSSLTGIRVCHLGPRRLGIEILLTGGKSIVADIQLNRHAQLLVAQTKPNGSLRRAISVNEQDMPGFVKRLKEISQWPG